MKTVTIKFVVEDDDVAYLHEEIKTALENELNPFPLYCWDEKDSSDYQIQWKEKQNKG